MERCQRTGDLFDEPTETVATIEARIARNARRRKKYRADQAKMWLRKREETILRRVRHPKPGEL